MVKYSVVVADPPFEFSDRLVMSSVKRGAESNYNGTLSIQDICDLPVSEICEDDALLALWVPGSFVSDGIKIMEAWNFDIKQTWVWCKIKKNPLNTLKKKIKKLSDIDLINAEIDKFDINKILSMYMGRTFRQAHEIALIGTCGKISKKLKNKSQRSVYFSHIGKHSEKPSGLQDKLEIMFPLIDNNSIELFARKERKGWTTVGNECPSTFGIDIRDALKEIIDTNAQNIAS